MPTIANYPDGIGTAGPTIARLIDQPIGYETHAIVMEDGGAIVMIQPCGLRRWLLEYEGLTQAELATLRAHKNLAKGKVNDFSFYHRRDAVTYAGVQIESWSIGDHQKTWAVPLSVVLVKMF